MKEGDRMPEYLGQDQDGKDITLEMLRGQKFILYAYPKDHTSGCTAQACSLRDHHSEILAAGYRVIGLSKDSQESHRKFIQAHDLPFDLISDPSTRLIQALGAWGEKAVMGRKCTGTLRTTFLVNEEGLIEKVITPKQIKTKIHAEQILKEIQ